MIDRRFLIITVTVLHAVIVSSITDHLVPPPPVSVPSQQLQPSVRGGPPRPQGVPHIRYADGPQNEQPGFIQRMARWFGFNDNSVSEQQLQSQASQQYPQYKESPRGYQQNGRNAPCGLCNNYPWVPMFPGNIQYPLTKHYQVPQANQIHQVQWNQQQEQQYQQIRYQQQQQQQLTRQHHEKLAGYNYGQQQKQLPAYPPLSAAESQFAPTHFQPPLVQRAVQFNPSPSQEFRPPPPPVHSGSPPPPFKPQPHFAPIPLPNLSPSALPPVYDAQPFQPVSEPKQKLGPTQFQQLPKYQPNVQFQSSPPTIRHEQQQLPTYVDAPQFQSPQPTNRHEQQHQPPTFEHNQPPSNNDLDQFAGISQTTAFEHIAAPSEIQTAYPTQISPSNFQGQQQDQLPHSTPSFEIVKSHQVTNFISEIQYPADFVQSQSIDVPQQQHSTTITPDSQHPVTLTELGSYSQQYTAPPDEPQTPSPEEQFQNADSIIYHNHQELDSYASDNYPSASSHNLSVQHDNHLDIDPIQHSSSENYRPQHEIFVPTPEPTTIQPQYVTDDSQQTTVEIVPSLQTTYSHRLNYKRDRETPKRLLDSPAHYLQGGSSPRPFTRDPSELQFRSSTAAPQYQSDQASATPTPWRMSPTPTSAYTSVEASGHFAGMTPPGVQQQTKQYHQIIIPYTTKHKPRPFQPKENAGRYDNWSTSTEFDPHEQQESKLVTATQVPGQRTTKYLTKILATNLRELLKKEHEVKNKSKPDFDLSKLQKNIDDWTEQEFTSLSHRASTVSLNAHSKHIPTEYFTTTPSFREAKTTVFAANHQLEPLLYKDRGTKRYEYAHIDDNRIEAHEITSSTPVPSTTTVSYPTTEATTTTTEVPTVTPFFTRTTTTTQAPKQDWNDTQVTVSPLTKEKVYVVTPQPVFFPGSAATFKSPRFIVRPTPASAGSNATPKPSLYTPELFGLMGISAYVPAAPVETIDGHSKVITVVTPSSIVKESHDDNEVGSSATKSKDDRGSS